MESEILTQLINVIFHPNPARGIVYCWVNGEYSKRLLLEQKFLNLIHREQPSTLPSARDALHTYSFYMWDVPEKKIMKLAPYATKADERDSLGKRLGDALNGIEPPTFKTTKEDTLETFLNSLGFEMPTEKTTKEFRVVLSKKAVEERKGIFQRIFQRNK